MRTGAAALFVADGHLGHLHAGVQFLQPAMHAKIDSPEPPPGSAARQRQRRRDPLQALRLRPIRISIVATQRSSTEMSIVTGRSERGSTHRNGSVIWVAPLGTKKLARPVVQRTRW